VTLPHRSVERPAIAVHNGGLFIFWTDRGTKQIATAFSVNGTTWSTPQGFGYQASSTPALASFDGQLHVAWTAAQGGYLSVATWNGVSLDPVTVPERSLVAPSFAVVGAKLWLSFVDSSSRYVTVLDSSGDLVFDNRRTYNLQSVKTPVIVDFRLPNRVPGPRLPVYIFTPLENVSLAVRF
jgi:hypothetical protein